MKAIRLIPIALAAAAAAQEPAVTPLPESVVTAAPAAQPSIVLAATATVTAATITLGDVAALTDTALASVSLAPAPLPGGRRVISRGQIAQRLARAGYRLDQVALSGADSVVVERLARAVTPAQVAAALAELLPLAVVIERIPPRRSLPDGAISWRLRSPLPAPLPELFNVALDILVDGRVADQLVVAVRRELPVVAPASLPAATAPSPTAPAEAAPPAAPAAPAAAPLAAPAPAAEERPAWVVKRGDKLMVMAISGRVRITIVAEAREDGRQGDIIQCQASINKERRLLAVRLVAPDRALLEL